jgi:hypothetical protein
MTAVDEREREMERILRVEKTEAFIKHELTE